MPNILIADDHRLVRSGIKQIISQDKNFKIFEAANSITIFKILHSESIDLMILDIKLPGKNGIDVLHQMKDENISIPVLVLSMYPPAQYAVRAFKAGAMGYLTKDSAPSEMLQAIDDILHGKKYISALHTEDIISQISATGEENIRDHRLLSDREFNVFIRLAQGRTISKIADDLKLSVKTVSTYRTRIFEKMNFQSVSDLITYALKNDMVDM